MAIIDPKGFFLGDRICRCSDSAQLHWPRLYAASNNYARLELSYEKVCALAYRSFSTPPTESEFWALVKEYRSNFLLFVYEHDGVLWGQWQTNDRYLLGYKNAEDKRSPAPDTKAQEAYRNRYRESKKAKSYSIERFADLLEDGESLESLKTSSDIGEMSEVHSVGVGVGVGKEQLHCEMTSGIEPEPTVAARAANEVDLSKGQPLPEPAAETSTQRRDRIVLAVWAYYCRRFNRSADYTLSLSRRRHGEKALTALDRRAASLGIPQNDREEKILTWFSTAIHRLEDSEFHNGKNDRKRKYVDWENLFRSAERRSPDHLTDFWLDDSRFEK